MKHLWYIWGSEIDHLCDCRNSSNQRHHAISSNDKIDIFFNNIAIDKIMQGAKLVPEWQRQLITN